MAAASAARLGLSPWSRLRGFVTCGQHPCEAACGGSILTLASPVEWALRVRIGEEPAPARSLHKGP